MHQTLTIDPHERFLQELRDSGGSMIRVASILGLLAFIGFGFVDPLLVQGEELRLALIVRAATSVFYLALIGVTLVRRWATAYARPLSLAAAFVTGGSLVALVYLTGGGVSDYHGAIVITMFGYCTLPVPWRKLDAPILYAVFLALYLVVHLGSGRIGQTGAFVTQTAVLVTSAVVAAVLQRILFNGRYRGFVHREELAAANARLTQLDEAKSRFFANLSHELRTPLTLMLAPVQALLESTRHPLDDAQREKLVLAQRNALRLLRLVDDLLALTRAESAAMSLSVAPLDLGQMVHRLVTDIDELAARKRLVIDTQLETVPLIEADQHLVERVLLNIVGNAAKFVKEGGRITLVVRPRSGGVELAVQDDGIGIAARDLPRIFDRFYQADSGSTRKTGGTGIGLSLVKEIMELHGGTVSAESMLGQGTTLRCWFPPSLPPEKARTATRVDPAGAALGSGGLPEWHEAIRRDKSYRLQGIDDATERRVAPRPQPRGKAPTVLVAEDNHDMIRFLVALLAYDFNVVTAQNGRDALRLALERRPDLIISDMMMPEMDGLQLVAEVRASPLTRHVPFIFLTARGADDDRVAGRQGGADIYLTKPFKSEELLAAVDALLARQTDMQRAITNREDEVVVFMASGVAEQLAPTIGTLEAARGLVAASAPHVWDEVAGGFDASLSLLSQLARGFDELARAGTRPVTEPADVAETTRLVVADVQRRIGDVTDRVVVTELAASERVLLTQPELAQILRPLLERAILVTPRGQTVTVGNAAAANGSVLVRIEDEGPTLAPDQAERIFFPFFGDTRHDPDGLGLARSRRLVLARGGSLVVEGRDGTGTRIVLRLPVAGDAQ